MKKSIYLSAIILCVLAINSYAKNKLSFTQDLSIKTGTLNNFITDVGAGSLVIRGADVNEITVRAKIYSEKYNNIEDLRAAFNSEMVLTLENKGKSSVLKAMTQKKWFSISSPEISIDLDIIVPQKMNIEIDDSSGPLKITDIDGSLQIDDGSGSIFISNIGDDIEIDDGSGNLEISDVKGDIHIDDGSGIINIDGVAGNVSIDDGSGSIKINELVGHFKLVDDGSGSVFVNGKRWVLND